MTCGTSGPAYCLPFCSICPCYGAKPEQASLSLPCCSIQSAARAGQLIICAARAGQPIICLSALFAPVMARDPSSERALRRRHSYHLLFCFICPPYGARPERASLLFAFSLNLPPLWRTAQSGPAYHCLATLYRARPERASLSFARPEPASLSFARSERASLSFALMPDLRRSPLCVKSAPRAGERPIILSRMVTRAVASMPKTAKCAYVAKKVKVKIEPMHAEISCQI